MKKDLFTIQETTEKIEKKLAEFKHDPQKMLVENMQGKMQDCKSITSSSANNSTCLKRIQAARDIINNHNETCKKALASWLLPSTDKRHITQKQLVSILENEGCKINICAFCYAFSDLSASGAMHENKAIKFAAVGKYFSERLLNDNELPIVPGFYIDNTDGLRHERIESFGDTENVIQARNYVRLVKLNSNVFFSVWSKNPEHYYQAFLLENGKPGNLKFILSSNTINKPDIDIAVYYNKLLPGMIDSVFTVWTENGAKQNSIILNCCGADRDKIIPRKCRNCMNCYMKDGNKELVQHFLEHPEIQAVNEILR